MGAFRNVIIVKFDRWMLFGFVFGEKITSLACLLGSGLRSSLRLLADLCMSETFEKRDVSSANILHNEFIPSGRSFMYIKNKSGPSTDPCGIPDIIFLHSDV